MPFVVKAVSGMEPNAPTRIAPPNPLAPRPLSTFYFLLGPGTSRPPPSRLAGPGCDPGGVRRASKAIHGERATGGEVLPGPEPVSGAGVVVALAAEARPLTGRRLRPGEAVQVGGGMVCLAGMGRDRARAAAERLVAGGATGLVSWGSGGGLDPGLQPGTVVVAEAVIAADGREWPVDAEWRARLGEAVAGHLPVAGGRVAEVAEVVGVAEKATLFRATGAALCDMESAAVAAVAAAAHLPFLVVRAVADPATVAVPAAALAAVGDDGRLRPAGVARLLLHPDLWPTLAATGRSFRRAVAGLDRLAAIAGAVLLDPGVPR